MMLWVVVFGAYFFGTAFMLVDEEEERLHHRTVVAPPLVRKTLTRPTVSGYVCVIGSGWWVGGREGEQECARATERARV